MKDNDKRFVRVYKQGVNSRSEIWVDKQTGVNYFYHYYGYGGGLTPLLGENGKPIITPIPEETK